MHSNFKAAATILMSNYPVEKNQTNLLLETSFFSELYLGYTRDAAQGVVVFECNESCGNHEI